MKNLILITLLFSFVLTSCKNDYDKAIFEVLNKSNKDIDSLIITNSANDEINTLSVYGLESNESLHINIKMTNTEGDGRYSLLYKMDEIWHSKHFGYYTNGSQIEELISIKVISSDSVNIQNKL